MVNSQTSFVIATRNRSTEMAATVERLLDTTRCPIILVDNASDDDSLAAACRLSARAGERMLVVGLDRNLGAVGRNVGVRACRTPYVAFCHDNSWWQPDAPEIAEETFARHPSVGVLAARTVVWPDHADDPTVPHPADSALGTWRDLPGPSVLCFLACSAVVRTEAFTAAGGFSPILRFCGEEQLLALDMAAQGWDLCYCEDLVAVRQPSRIRPTTADARNLLNAVLTTWLRRPPRLCLRCCGDLLQAAIQDAEHARAAAEAVARIPRVLAQRRQLPRRVELAARMLETGCRSA